VSWGGHESLVIPRMAAIKKEHFNPTNPEHRMIRLYIGLEEATYLQADLEQAFAHLL
jgi:cystathionine beta-lyase/cystathionine gamma-synthase